MDRRDFVCGAALSMLSALACRSAGHGPEDEESRAMQPSTHRGRMPVVFVGHGSPMNAIEDNTWSRGFVELASHVPTPTAILAVSAHWFTRGTYVTSNTKPTTIHDFGGFPRTLREVSYPAAGHPDLAKRIHQQLANPRGALTSDWGLDHGTWSVLRWMYPQADIPVVQVSIDRRLADAAHYEMAHSLEVLRHQGVLILCSGNIVHNLGDAIVQMHSPEQHVPSWAREFDSMAAAAVANRDTRTLLTIASTTDSGRKAHPSRDHWLPLMYAMGATDDSDTVRTFNEGFDMGSLSMRSMLFA